jgi:ABC-2 type transport system permease protein
VKLTAVKASTERGDSIIATGYGQYSLGMTIWFVLMLVLGNAESLLEERENGTLPRLLTTPTPRAQVLGGKVGGVYTIGIVQAAILITFSALVFSVDWGTDPLATSLLIGTFTLAATGLAIMVAATARTREQAGGLGPVIAMSLAMLGGCVWPIEVVPPFMKIIALFTPTGWAMAGLTDVVVRNQGLQAAIIPSLVLLGFSAVFFLIGLTRFRWE